ncbi:MAG: hypothetical protein ACO238_07465 [Ilumatobacteraceae bacterium]
MPLGSNQRPPRTDTYRSAQRGQAPARHEPRTQPTMGVDIVYK